ncbi:hypothetical protein HXX76_001289 [Chlamydomonas incerta]|uniref:Malic enzyme n=1 Tax=Chlamydomonas incerta TaxID=51695 RepID=A0A835WBV4_CHLIN|nr:hypothetical protein HXX76_001289 [Chlamydomonas incerta]|eukprot:KAG2444543.1 hypothetical protein HXX76_001289 [Chlamydomonas incerta]
MTAAPRQKAGTASAGGDEAPLMPGRRAVLLGGAAGAGSLLAAAAAPLSAPNALAVAAAVPAAEVAAAAAPAGPAAAAAAAVPGLRAWQALREPSLNRGLATPAAARRELGLDGLLPAPVTPPELEVARAAAGVERAGAGGPLLQYSALMGLRESDRDTFYGLVQSDVERYLPLIYTPTVGDACLSWGSLLPRPTGLTISLADAGRVQALVDNWAAGQPQARIAVITDGERILGLGDLGAHGLGIPVGKAAVYGAAGVDPGWVVPVVLDVGCDTPEVVTDPLYVGLRRRRERGPAYYDLVDEAVAALRATYGAGLLVHWEDVGGSHAVPLLQRLQAAGVPTFNDDIQATAAVALAALLGAERVPGVPPLQQQTFLFFGAGQANLGVAALLVSELVSRGVSEAAAREAVWLVDSRGLVTDDRPNLSRSKAVFAKPRPPALGAPGSSGLASLGLGASNAIGGGGGGAGGAAGGTGDSLADLVQALRPTALIGAAAVGGAFDREVLELLAQVQPSASSRPTVFALSNPTSKAECSFEQAWRYTGGRAVFASGTQFAALTVPAPSRGLFGALLPSSSSSSTSNSGSGPTGGYAYGGRTLVPAQANNCLVFPGLGQGCVLSGAEAVTDGMLLAAARAVAAMASPADLEAECVLPRVGRLAEAAVKVAAAVASAAAVDMVATVGVGAPAGSSGGSGGPSCSRELFLSSSAAAAPAGPAKGAQQVVAASGRKGGSSGGGGAAGGAAALEACIAKLQYRPL